MKKVFVGLSGGVDSSVSAYLLKKQGFDVTGVFIKVWYPEFISCNWRKEMHDAMRICAKLKIPFLLCDLESEYKKGVIDYMINEYKLGRTPNPDVMCNKEVKFKAFFDFAMKNRADYIATGHYAQNIEEGGKFHLINSVDNEKDQTYFIWNLNQKVLSKVLFPIGHLQKSEVRKIAKKAGLLTSAKKDSQGLCFIGHVNMKDFLRKFLETVPGDVLNKKGEIIGRHSGSILYTIGERHGFEIFHKKSEDTPLYVTKKDSEKNVIIVSNIKKETSTNKITINNINLIQNESLLNKNIEVKTRYRQDNQKSIVVKQNSKEIELLLENQQNSLSAGQSVVFYNGKECLGGGVIV
jgi:tRNA-uridine 2-sulfurtransferase